ncbi:dockerin type I domain-containing protein [Candidatus Bathyarchaeota archaeon]|nr:dockerin type I domain-containing protein [Candidatus Bathyarchaeota archaeon]
MNSISYCKLSGVIVFLLTISLFGAISSICIVNASGDLNILEVVPCDVSGNPKTSFEIGKIAYFKVSIEYLGSVNKNVLLSANVYDSTGTTQGISWSNVTLFSKSSVFILNMPIPKSAHVGQAFVYVGAYSGFPCNMGFPLCPEFSATFQLVSQVLLGDVTGPVPNVPDGKVNMMDVSAVIAKFGTTPSSSNWNPNMDLNKDGVVGMRDLYIVLSSLTR